MQGRRRSIYPFNHCYFGAAEAVLDLNGLYQEAENIRKSALYTFVTDTVNSIKIPINMLEPIKSILDLTVNLLDNLFLPIVSEDIKDYAKDLEEMDREASLKKLISYYFERAASVGVQIATITDSNVGEHYLRYMQQKFELFFQRLTQVRQNLRDFFQLTLNRIAHDYQIIGKAFIPHYQEGCSLEIKSIKLMGSDFHMRNQQVLLIHVNDSNGNIGQFIYKPFNLKMDAYFVGEIQKAKQCGTYIELDNSVCEILNEQLKSEKKPTYPTYLIIPRVDNNNTTTTTDQNAEAITGSCIKDYGYIEYLSHDPWPVEKIKENIKKTILHRSENSTKVEKLWLSGIKEALSSLSNSNDSDFLADESEEKNYWQLCGMWLALFLVFKISDMHVENLIVSKKKPYPIDLEVCFNSKIEKLSNLDCLDHDFGSISASSNNVLKMKMLFGVRKKDYYTIQESVEEKNILFRQENGEVVRSRLDIEALQNGFNNGLAKIINNRETIVNSHTEFLRTCYCRALSFNTSSLNTMAQEYPAIYHSGTNFRKDEFEQWKSDLESGTAKSKNFLAIDNVFKNSLFIFDVPKFFFRLDQMYLYNSEGQPLYCKGDELTEINKSLSSTENPNHYLSASPLDGLLAYFKHLPEAQETVKSELHCLLSLQTTETTIEFSSVARRI